MTALDDFFAFAQRPRAACSGEEWAKLKNAARAEIAWLRAEQEIVRAAVGWSGACQMVRSGEITVEETYKLANVVWRACGRLERLKETSK